MNKFIKLIPVLFALTMTTNLLAQAPSEQRWQAFNQGVIDQHIVPNYRALAQSSVELDTSIKNYCADQTSDKLTRARQAFTQGQQAWQKIQHIQFGPVTLLMRNFSLQYWPDKKNLAGRQLNSLLKEALQGEGHTEYNGEFFARASVAVKGFPALERMLFEQKILLQLPTNSGYCPLMSAIGEHVAQNTQEIVSEWDAEWDNYQNYSEEAVYISAQEAATDILKALVEPIEAISDGKIAAPLGAQLDKMRWRKSESWRSGQSVANIRSNLTALRHLYSGVDGASLKALLVESGEQPLATRIDRQFTEVIQALSNVSEPNKMQYQQAQFDALVNIQDQLKRLSDSLHQSMQPLQISLGFNRRDGD